MRSRFGIMAVFAMAAFLASPAANASPITYNWTASIPLSAGGTLTGSGQIVINGNLATAMTGTYNGSAITGLAPINTKGGNDNLVFPGQSPLLTGGGISFYVSPNVWGGNVVNVWYTSGFGGGYTDNGGTLAGSFTLSESQVPEPATITLLTFGALAGAGLRKLRRRGL